MGRKVVMPPKKLGEVFKNADEIVWPSVKGAVITHMSLSDHQGNPVADIPINSGTANGVTFNSPNIVIGGSGSAGGGYATGGGGGGGAIVITGGQRPVNYDETNVLEGGEVVMTHRLANCSGYWCPIHNPSPHHMRSWRQTFNFPMKVIMRVCPCGEEHPDPDDRDGFRIGHSCHCHHCSPNGRVVQRRLKRTVTT